MSGTEGSAAKARSQLVGAHMSIAGGVWKALTRAVEEGCSVAQIFTKNASQWHAPVLTKGDALRFLQVRAKSGLAIVVAHNSYLINLASPMASLRARSRQALFEELKRAELLGLSWLVIHPGAHTGSGDRAGMKRVAEALNWLHDRSKEFRTGICLENTAGQGTVLGGDFGHFGEILSRIKEPERIGLCLDTCHAFAAGYDLRRQEGYEAAMASLEKEVGPDRIRVVHVNDAKGELGGKLDRHEQLGRGGLGLECFRLIMNDSRLRQVPKILETPKEDDGLPMDRVNITILRALAGKEKVPARLIEKTVKQVKKTLGLTGGAGNKKE